jgi:hypothetical protein
MLRYAISFPYVMHLNIDLVGLNNTYIFLGFQNKGHCMHMLYTIWLATLDTPLWR